MPAGAHGADWPDVHPTSVWEDARTVRWADEVRSWRHVLHSVPSASPTAPLLDFSPHIPPLSLRFSPSSPPPLFSLLHAPTSHPISPFSSPLAPLHHSGQQLSLKELYEFVNEKAPSAGLANLRLSPQATDFIANTCADKTKASLGIGLILFTAKFDSSLLMKSVAHALRGKVAVGEVRGSNDKLAR